MGMVSKALVAAVAGAFLMQGSPAAAQYMPHLDPNLYILATMNYGVGADPCMAGTAMSDAKVAEARTPAPAVMQSYFLAAQGGGAKSAAFHLDKNTKWTAAGVTAGSPDIDRQTDPLAVAGTILEAEPVRFYRGGTGATALGQWIVADANGNVAGVYTAFFARIKKQWKLRELAVSQAGDTLEPVAQFCRKAGDVIEHRLSSTKTWRENAGKNVEETKAKLAQARLAASDASAAAQAKPKEAALAAKARDANSKVSRLTKQLDQREKNLAEAIEKSAEAQKDADEIKRLTGEARNARNFKQQVKT